MRTEGVPRTSLYLTIPSAEEETYSSEEPFIIELTTRPVTRRVTRMRIEMGSIEDLVRVWMLSRLMEYPNCGPTFTPEGCSLALRDPDQHRIELFAPGHAVPVDGVGDQETESLDEDEERVEWRNSADARPEVVPSRFVLANRFSTRQQWPG